MILPSPKVSIVLCAYNAERFLSPTLESVLAQSWKNWELVLVNDGSADGTETVAMEFQKRDSRIRYVVQSNSGVASARNRGFKESDPAAEFIIFLDHDDLWPPDTLEVLLNILQQNPEAAGAHGSVEYINSKGDLIQDSHLDEFCRREEVRQEVFVRLSTEEPTTFSTMAARCCLISPGVVLLRRAVLEETELFDLEMAPSDDWDLWLRITRNGYFVSVPQTVLRYRVHENNVSRDRNKMRHAKTRVWNKALRSQENTQEHRRILLETSRALVAGKYRQNREKAAESLRQRQIRAFLRSSMHALRLGIKLILGTVEKR